MQNYLIYLPIAAVLVIYTARMMEIAKKRNLVKGEIKENVTLLMFKLVGLFTVLAGITEYFVSQRPFSLTCLVIGVLISAASFTIRNLAIRALGLFWSLHVEIRSNHEFVRSGPFHYVRHPAYTSMALEIISVGVILQAPISTLVALIFFVPVLYKRIAIEEKELIAKFGSSYVDYKKTTPAFLPIKIR